MKEFVIITDACCDLGKDIREKIDIEYLNMPLTDSKKNSTKADLDWTNFSAKDFYNNMRNGEVYKTSQINITDYIDKFTEYLDKGMDVLSISCSSGLSGSYNCSIIAREELLQTYPDANIYCVDTLRGSLGEGAIVYYAAKMKPAGKSIKEIVQWIEENKLNVNQIGSVETLTYLQRAGRVKSTMAFFGNLFKIKPLIVADAVGQNFVLRKVNGRKKSLVEIVEYTKENVINPEEQTLFIVHADCYEEAVIVRDEILKDVKFKDVYMNYVGPIIGSSVGPGMIGVYYFGKTQDLNKVSN